VAPDFAKTNVYNYGLLENDFTLYDTKFPPKHWNIS